MSERTLELTDPEEARSLFGPRDAHLRRVRERLGVELGARDLKVWMRGEPAALERAERVLGGLLERVRAAGALSDDDVRAYLDEALGSEASDAAAGEGGGEVRARESAGGDAGGRLIEGVRLRSDGQRRYVEDMRTHDVVFAIGPAGTGKTFLAVLMAIQALKRGEVQRLVLCRPAVEAGESLGFLPGDFQAKVNPYMRPLYDSLYALLDFDTVKRYLEREVIEVAPLAYMRGRTLSSSFVILDEAQNTTRSQMKMFLTRLGEGSKIVVTGDVTQVDLPQGVTSGLVHARSILKGTKGIAFAELTGKDIVRHNLVWRIIQAYEGPEAGRTRRGKRG